MQTFKHSEPFFDTGKVRKCQRSEKLIELHYHMEPSVSPFPFPKKSLTMNKVSHKSQHFKNHGGIL